MHRHKNHFSSSNHRSITFEMFRIGFSLSCHCIRLITVIIIGIIIIRSLSTHEEEKKNILIFFFPSSFNMTFEEVYHNRKVPTRQNSSHYSLTLSIRNNPHRTEPFQSIDSIGICPQLQLLL